MCRSGLDRLIMVVAEETRTPTPDGVVVASGHRQLQCQYLEWWMRLPVTIADVAAAVDTTAIADVGPESSAGVGSALPISHCCYDT